MRANVFKIAGCLVAVGLVASLAAPPGVAQTSQDGLKVAVDGLSAIVQRLADAWRSPDTSAGTAGLQAGFSQLGTAILQSQDVQMRLQQRLSADLLGGGSPLPFANDLLYSTVLGSPYLAPDPRTRTPSGPTIDAAYNYIKNASGINGRHVAPSPAWAGPTADQENYSSYYGTVMATQSFAGYVLSQDYADGARLNAAQTALVRQATDANWYVQVATQDPGVVLRQLLMYQSQNFVLLTQLLEAQRQAVAAQAMTNALLVATSRDKEAVLLARAQGLAR